VRRGLLLRGGGAAAGLLCGRCGGVPPRHPRAALSARGLAPAARAHGEFKGAFDDACRQLGLRHTRTQPRHPWTNGFVERLQGTILQEHWRVQFRRRYFTSCAALARSLAEFMRFYNDQRPHQGYRLRGHTPSALFHGAAAAHR